MAMMVSIRYPGTAAENCPEAIRFPGGALRYSQLDVYRSSKGTIRDIRVVSSLYETTSHSRCSTDVRRGSALLWQKGTAILSSTA